MQSLVSAAAGKPNTIGFRIAVPGYRRRISRPREAPSSARSFDADYGNSVTPQSGKDPPIAHFGGEIKAALIFCYIRCFSGPNRVAP